MTFVFRMREAPYNADRRSRNICVSKYITHSEGMNITARKGNITLAKQEYHFIVYRAFSSVNYDLSSASFNMI